jgi:hypothetical protein
MLHVGIMNYGHNQINQCQLQIAVSVSGRVACLGAMSGSGPGLEAHCTLRLASRPWDLGSKRLVAGAGAGAGEQAPVTLLLLALAASARQALSL